MKLSLNNTNLTVLKYGKCENCAFHHKHIEFCTFLHLMGFKDSKIFYETPYNSSIFNL